MMTLLLVVVGVNAQKIDQRLTRLVEKSVQRRAQGAEPLDPQAVNKTIAVSFNVDGTIESFSGIAILKDGAECPTARLEQMGVQVRFQYGKMVALNIPADKLQALEEVEEISYVKADEMLQPTNDLARKETKADQIVEAAKAAAAGLPQAYTGKDVVLGIIDQGIDYNHGAFRHADGSTRVVKAFLMNDNNGHYSSATGEEITGFITDNMTSSHGTHTAATAAGSELGNGQQGVAPEVDIVLCGLNTYTSTTNIAGFIKEIFAYAKQVNKPAVVSISMGNIIDLHDGSDLIAEAVRNETVNGTKPGRVVLISSSNSAANWQSIVQSGTTKTVLGSASEVTATAPAVYNSLYCFYASDYQDFTIALKVVDTTTGQVSYIGNHVLHQKSGAVMENFDLTKVSNYPTATSGKNAVFYYLSCVDPVVKLDDPKYRLAIVATSKDGQNLKLICNGDNNAEPCFDAPIVTGGYNFAANDWTKGNGNIAISASICDDAVISVGSYITRTGWETWEGKGVGYPESTFTGKTQHIGEISDFSSWGTDDNGKNYPTIIAPGQGTISAANNYDYSTFMPDEDNPGGAVPNPLSNDAKNFLIGNIDKFNRRNWYVLEQGTSMSCPHAAGIIALWLQAKPSLTVNEIKSVLKATCVNDKFTTNIDLIPSRNKVQAGFGKIDCLAGLQKILNITGIEAIEVGGHREATPSTMYSVDAPVYNMMGQRVDKNTRGFVIYKGRKYVNK